MTEQEIVSRIKRIIQEDIGVGKEYTFDSSLLTSGVMDSMDWIAFLTKVEDEFGIEISSEDATKHVVAILDNLVAYLRANLN